MEINVEYLNKQDIELPKVLYKYREWDKHQHRTMLSLQQVYMAAPSTFEDKNEFRNFKRYDLMTVDEVKELYYRHSLVDNPNFNQAQHEHFAAEWSLHNPFQDAEYLLTTQEHHYNEYDQRVGVLCLTNQRDNKDMWNYYAKQGKGFCVGINYNELVQAIKPHGGGGEVIYCDELPIISGLDDYPHEHIKRTYYKLRQWEFESEYRTTIFKPNPLSKQERVVTLPRKAITEVIVGWDMRTKDIDRLVKICNTHKLEAKLFQALRGESVVIKEL